VHEGTRTPYLALLASGALILFMALAIPIEDVAAAADVMFLLLFLQVNVAIITIRRKYGEALDYGFLTPFFPVIPVIAIVLMIGIAAFMFRFSPTAWFFVIGWIGAGVIIYYTYARKRERAKRATPRLPREPTAPAEERYRILVPVADPAKAGVLIDFAAMVARARGGEIVLLHVISVPRQTPLEVGRRYVRAACEEVLDEAADMAADRGIPSSTVIRIAHWPAEAIVHEVEERRIDMVVMGWRGRSKHPRTVIGRNIDRVMRHADCHVVVVRADDLDTVKNVLVPIAYPRQARLMLELARLFERERGANVELFHLLPPDLSESERSNRLDKIYEALADLDVTPEQEEGRSIRVEETDRVVSRIVSRSAEFDLTILGASREGWYRKLIAGTVPERIARGMGDNALLLVKHERSPIKSWVLDLIDFFRDTRPVTGRKEVSGS
jgi:nucleotide-binding universal stress UspA family protein